MTTTTTTGPETRDVEYGSGRPGGNPFPAAWGTPPNTRAAREAWALEHIHRAGKRDSVARAYLQLAERDERFARRLRLAHLQLRDRSADLDVAS